MVTSYSSPNCAIITNDYRRLILRHNNSELELASELLAIKHADFVQILDHQAILGNLSGSCT